jgi:hypothetical protein
MTGISDPKVDAWVRNQELYKIHGMAHPAAKKKVEPERRSRSPLLPGPRKTKSFQEELFDKYLAEKYPVMPERLIRYSFMDDEYIIQELFPKGFPMEFSGFWRSSVSDSRGRGTMRGYHPSRIQKEAIGRKERESIYPWKHISRPVDWKATRDYIMGMDFGAPEPIEGDKDEDKGRSGRQIRHFPPTS